MATQIEQQKKVILTQAQFNARKLAGTLVQGVEYEITDAICLPDPPTTAGTYKLQCVVDANGKATLSWVVEA